MEETVFFNRGNAIATNFDVKELYRTAQIEQTKQPKNQQLIIVKDQDNGEHILFNLFDQQKDGKVKEVKAYTVQKIL